MKRFCKPLAFVVIAALFFTTLPPPQEAHAILDNEPTRKVEIQIQSSKVDATLADFPVLLTEDNVPSEVCDADGTSPAQNGGGDIRFTSDEGGNEQLALEVVDFTTNNDPANCTVEMYVKVPFVSSTADTSIWMWYNTSTSDSQPAASSTYGSENVWDSDFLIVYHMNQDPSGTAPQMLNSASSSHDGTSEGSMTGGDLVSGKIGNGIEFDDTDDNITAGDIAALDGADALTAESWSYLNDLSQVDVFSSKSDGNTSTTYNIVHRESGKARSHISNTWSTTDSTVYSADTWHHTAFRYDGNGSTNDDKVQIIVDGTSAALSHNGTIPSTLPNTSEEFWVGDNDRSGGSDTPMNGILDEIRISTSVRSDEWLDATYENGNNPGAFAIEQTPEDGSTAPSASSVVKGADESVTSSTTLQNDDDFSFTLAANTEYVISSGFFATSSSATPDIKIAFTIPAGATMDIGYLAQGGSARRAELLEASGTASARIPIPANQNTIIQAFGSVVTGSTGGTLNLQWAQFTSNGNATKVKQGSFMTVTEVTE